MAIAPQSQMRGLETIFVAQRNGQGLGSSLRSHAAPRIRIPVSKGHRACDNVVMLNVFSGNHHPTHFRQSCPHVQWPDRTACVITIQSDLMMYSDSSSRHPIRCKPWISQKASWKRWDIAIRGELCFTGIVRISRVIGRRLDSRWVLSVAMVIKGIRVLPILAGQEVKISTKTSRALVMWGTANSELQLTQTNWMTSSTGTA